MQTLTITQNTALLHQDQQETHAEHLAFIADLTSVGDGRAVAAGDCRAVAAGDGKAVARGRLPGRTGPNVPVSAGSKSLWTDFSLDISSLRLLSFLAFFFNLSSFNASCLILDFDFFSLCFFLLSGDEELEDQDISALESESERDELLESVEYLCLVFFFLFGENSLDFWECFFETSLGCFLFLLIP